MLPRPEPIRQIELTFQRCPVITLLGPRQRGKTTLARFMAGQEPSTVFNLENPVDVQRRPLLCEAIASLKEAVSVYFEDENSEYNVIEKLF